MYGKLDETTAQAIIDDYVAGATSSDLAVKFKIHKSSVQGIVKGVYWKQCKRPTNIVEIIHSRRGFKRGWNDDSHSCLPLLTCVQSEIINGSLLGDGSIRKTSSNCYFSKGQCVGYKEYVEWRCLELKPFSKSILSVYSKAKPVFCKETNRFKRIPVPRHLTAYLSKTCCHPIFNDLRNKWYPNGKKVVPQDLNITPLTLAIWYCDDGSNDGLTRRRAVLCTQSFSLEDVDFLRNILFENFKIKSTNRKIIAKDGSDQWIITITKESYDTLIDIVSPYVIWDCMKHKLINKRTK